MKNFAGFVKRHLAGIFCGYRPLTAWFLESLAVTVKSWVCFPTDKTLFRNLYTSISDKVQQESIEKVGVVCTKTISYCMSTLYLTANISQ